MTILKQRKRFNVVACGRRFGKTYFGINEIAAQFALDGYPFGWFAPTYKYLLEPFEALRKLLLPVVSKANATEMRIELVTGGVLDFWTLENKDAGRGRKYKSVLVDEAGFASNLGDAWQSAIRPTLTDMQGEAWFMGTPKGRNFFHTLFSWGKDPAFDDWAAWQMPTTANTSILGLAAEVAIAKASLPDRVFRQEYEAEFIEESGGVFTGVRECVGGLTEKTAPVAGRNYRLGWDIAKTQDFSVVAVVNDLGEQVYFDRFQGVGWESQIQRVAGIAREYGASSVVDSSGVGDPIYDRLVAELPGLPVTGFKFTSSSKTQLINNLALLIEQQQIKLMDIPVQTNELQAYEYKITAGGNVTSSAPDGMHDDCVMALALAVWSSKVRTWDWEAWN